MKVIPEIDSAEWDYREIRDEDIEPVLYFERIRLSIPLPNELLPWLKLSPQDRERNRELWRGVRPVLPVARIKCGETPRFVGKDDIFLHIPVHQSSKEQVLDEIKAILDSVIPDNRPTEIRNQNGEVELLIHRHSKTPSNRNPFRKLKRGKGGRRVAVEKLKHLSAYVLSSYGLNFKDSLEFLRKSRERLGISGWPSVWPVYSTPKAFNTAVNAIKSEVKKNSSFYRVVET